MPKLLATVGGLIMCAGIDLLWQSRSQFGYWVETFLKYVSMLGQRPLPARVLASGAAFLKRQGALQVALGLSFVLFVGPLLLVLSLTLMLYPQ
jgi:hypothetical protein